MTKSMAAGIAALVLAIGCAVSPPARAADARLLGSTRLARAENDTDVLRFGKCRRGIGAIQLRVARGSVEVERVWVRYARGSVDRLDVRERIAEGRATRWIDLRGGERCVKAIGIVGDTELSLDQARVDVWGR